MMVCMKAKDTEECAARCGAEVKVLGHEPNHTDLKKLNLLLHG